MGQRKTKGNATFMTSKAVFCCVFNDIDYIQQTLTSILEWDCPVFVIEGSFQITQKSTRKKARSDDGTLDILNDFKRRGLIELYYENKFQHQDQYNVGYQKCIEKGVDWALLVDSDEIHTKNSLLMMDRAISVDDGSLELLIDEYCFINSFNNFYYGTYPRLFKCIPGSKFVFDNEVQFKGFERGQHKKRKVLGRNVYHYGYCRSFARWFFKQIYMMEKDGNPLNLQYGIKGNSYIIPNDLKVYEFQGNHPTIMKTHKWYDVPASEIIYPPLVKFNFKPYGDITVELSCDFKNIHQSDGVITTKIYDSNKNELFPNNGNSKITNTEWKKITEIYFEKLSEGYSEIVWRRLNDPNKLMENK